MATKTDIKWPARVWAAIGGGLIALVGLVLLVGGGRLVQLGGSAYYLLAGAGVTASGVLLFGAGLWPVWSMQRFWPSPWLGPSGKADWSFGLWCPGWSRPPFWVSSCCWSCPQPLEAQTVTGPDGRRR